MKNLAHLLRSSFYAQRYSPLIWGGSLGAFCALIAAIWPSIEDSIGKAIQSYPESLKRTFNIQSLDNVEQYVDVEMLSFIIPLAMAYYAIRLVSRESVQAEEEGFLDSLLSLPLGRRSLIWMGFVLAAIMTLLSLLLMWLLTWIVGQLAGTNISALIMLKGFLNVWPLSILFAGLAVLLSAFAHRSIIVVGAGSGILVAMYVIDLVGKLSDPIRPLRNISAFKYYGSAIQNGLDLTHILVLVVSGLLLATIGAELFRRKDIL